jgi:hypothetical protein
LLLALGFAGRAAAEPASGPSPEAVAYLVGRQRQVSLRVSSERAEGKDWIRMQADFETAYRAGIEETIAVIRDFEGGPRIFSRIASVKLRSDDGTVAVTEQRTVVRALGLAFVSDVTFRNLLVRSGSSRALISFETIETDGSVLKVTGSWDLMEVQDGSDRLTYLRYRLDNWTAPRAPGQEAVMRAFGAGDMRKVLRELGAAIERRTARLTPLAGALHY